MQKNKFVFLIRAYNELSRIEAVIESIFHAGYAEILLVDDGSTDGLEAFIHEKYHGKISLVRHAINRGGGAAMETGFAYIRKWGRESGWEYVVTFDADGQMDIGDMDRFRHVLEKHPDAKVIFGSRFIEKTDSNVPWYRRIVLFGGRIFTSLISGVRLTDAHNGYRLMSRDVIERVRLTMDGMEYASELIDQIGECGYVIREVPVNIHYDAYTLAKGQRYGGPLRIMLRMISKKFF